MRSIVALIPSVFADSDALPLDTRWGQPLICEGAAKSQRVNICQPGRVQVDTDGSFHTGDKSLSSDRPLW